MLLIFTTIGTIPSHRHFHPTTPHPQSPRQCHRHLRAVAVLLSERAPSAGSALPCPAACAVQYSRMQPRRIAPCRFIPPAAVGDRQPHAGRGLTSCTSMRFAWGVPGDVRPALCATLSSADSTSGVKVSARRAARRRRWSVGGWAAPPGRAAVGQIAAFEFRGQLVPDRASRFAKQRLARLEKV